MTTLSTTTAIPPTTQSIFHGATSTTVADEGSNFVKARRTIDLLDHIDDDVPKMRDEKKLIVKAMFYGGGGGWYFGETLNGIPHGKGVLKFFGKDGKVEVEYKGFFKDGQEHDYSGEMYWYGPYKVANFTGQFQNGVAYGGKDEFDKKCKLVGSKIDYNV